MVLNTGTGLSDTAEYNLPINIKMHGQKQKINRNIVTKLMFLFLVTMKIQSWPFFHFN